MEIPAKKRMAHGICWKYIQMTPKTTNGTEWGVHTVFVTKYVRQNDQKILDVVTVVSWLFCSTVTEVQFF